MNRFTPLCIDKDEAPTGYYAVAKKDLRPIFDLSSDSKKNENICHSCDYTFSKLQKQAFIEHRITRH